MKAGRVLDGGVYDQMDHDDIYAGTADFGRKQRIYDEDKLNHQKNTIKNAIKPVDLEKMMNLQEFFDAEKATAKALEEKLMAEEPEVLPAG